MAHCYLELQKSVAPVGVGDLTRQKAGCCEPRGCRATGVGEKRAPVPFVPCEEELRLKWPRGLAQGGCSSCWIPGFVRTLNVGRRGAGQGRTPAPPLTWARAARAAGAGEVGVEPPEPPQNAGAGAARGSWQGALALHVCAAGTNLSGSGLGP